MTEDVVKSRNRTCFLCGLAAGTFQAGLFNPVDRALYLSVRDRVPFLSLANFVHPYQGFLQSIGGRAISGGLYFPLEHLFRSITPPDSGALANFAAGTGAGALNAIILNPLSAIKYKTWGREVNRGMINEMMGMWRKGGIRPFLNGLAPTLCRDVAFGGFYTFLRLQAQRSKMLSTVSDDHEYDWAYNFLAAAVATVVSAPFNFVRNVQYATKSREITPTIYQVLKKLSCEVLAKENHRTRIFFLGERLRFGWGTVRVALGMSFGQHVYNRCMLDFRNFDPHI